MIIRVVVALVLLAIPLGHSFGQGQGDLDKLDDKFTKYFERIMPGWTHKRGEPIVKTENVLIEFWYASNRSVKISVAPHKSGEEAREALQAFIKYEAKRETLKDFGDEGYAWGYGSSNIVFRRGRCVVYVSTNAEIDADPDARTLTQEQRFEREKSEMRRLSLEFAKHAVNALDKP